MEIRNQRIVVTIPDADWRSEIEKGIYLRARESREASARGRILGEAMHILRHRAAARRGKGWNGPSDDDVMEAAVFLRKMAAFGHNEQAFERIRRGLSIPMGVRPAAGSASLSSFMDEARDRLYARHALDQRLHTDAGRLPPGWTIDVIGSLPPGYESESHVSDVSW